MALIEGFEKVVLERDAPHKVVRCSYSIVIGEGGERYLQLDTYGSSSRQIPDKKSQSLRFTPDALKALLNIVRDNDL